MRGTMEVSTVIHSVTNSHGNGTSHNDGNNSTLASTDLLAHHASDIFHTSHASPYSSEKEDHHDDNEIYEAYTPEDTSYMEESSMLPTSSSSSSTHVSYPLLPNADKEALHLFEPITECLFRGGAKGRAEGMLGSESFPCQCQYEPDVDDREVACGEDSNCVNRHLYIECNPEDCPCGNYCLNRRFQQREYAAVQAVKTEKKGYGLQALEGLEANAFVMEYVGEVLPQSWFVKRARQYAQEGIAHHYFMTLNNEEYIDATKKGSYARFINHSCNPNCVLQKWTVGARTRMGIFTLRRVLQGEELTFDYKFQRYGAEAQPCYCGEPNCKGYIGSEGKSTQKQLELDLAFFTSSTTLEDNETELDDSTELALESGTRRNRLSKRHRRRQLSQLSDNEDIYEDESDTERKSTTTSHRHNKNRPRGLQTMEQVEKFVPLMMKYANQLDYAQKLLVFLNMTESSALLRKFMNTHGLQVLKLYLVEYHHKSDELCRLILGLMDRLPITIRNTVNACRADEVVEMFTTHDDVSISSMANKLIDDWKDLKVVYKIPKRSKPPPPPSRTTEMTSDQPANYHDNPRPSSSDSYSPPPPSSQTTTATTPYNYQHPHDRSNLDDAEYDPLIDLHLIIIITHIVHGHNDIIINMLHDITIRVIMMLMTHLIIMVITIIIHVQAIIQIIIVERHHHHPPHPSSATATATSSSNVGHVNHSPSYSSHYQRNYPVHIIIIHHVTLPNQIM
ncbi:hypothetical protein BDF22DRAFT_524931 [Syncephalis plumigaleata]|nr:hypothetical protein BDF22DRAFT_524931 [Syncephalis plumigaleata]